MIKLEHSAWIPKTRLLLQSTWDGTEPYQGTTSQLSSKTDFFQMSIQYETIASGTVQMVRPYVNPWDPWVSASRLTTNELDGLLIS